MRFLALATSDDAWFASLAPDAARSHAAAEAQRALALHDAGVIRSMYWRTDRRDVVIELEAIDEDAARAALAELPFVQIGCVTFELIGLQPYDGWDQLVRTRAGRGGHTR